MQTELLTRTVSSIKKKKKKTSKSFFLRYKEENCKLKEETGGRESRVGSSIQTVRRDFSFSAHQTLKGGQVRVSDLSPRKVNQQL